MSPQTQLSPSNAATEPIIDEVTLPNLPKIPMHLGYLTELALEALKESNAFARTLTVDEEVIQVWRTTENGASTRPFRRPSLMQAATMYVTGWPQLPASQAFLDYLWQHGRHSLTLIGPSTQAAWLPGAYTEVIIHQLVKLWDEESIRAFHTHGAWTPWEVSDAAFAKMASYIAAAEMNDGAWARAIVPMVNVSFEGSEPLELMPGVTMRKRTWEDIAVFIHQSGRSLENIDFSALANERVDLEIGLPLDVGESIRLDYRAYETAFAKLVDDVMARFRWAAMLALDTQNTLLEGITRMQTFGTSWGGQTLRRQALGYLWSGIPAISETAATEMARLLKTLRLAEAKFDADIYDAVWMFGRASLAAHPRDALLEAAIGLERILVPGSGENARRFRTHGAALLGDVGFETRLKALYNSRSKVAHEGNAKGDLSQSAMEARQLLAKCIERAAAWVEAGLIDSAPPGKMKLSVAVEEYLLRRLCASVSEDLAARRQAAST